MKVFQIFIYSFTFILLFSIFAPAQTNKTDSLKVVSINSEKFRDVADGIKELADAYVKLDSEFDSVKIELKSLYERYEKLVAELKSIATAREVSGISQKYMDNLINDTNLLGTELKSKQGDAKSKYERREKELTFEINEKIKIALNEFAKENNYPIVLDSSKLDSSPIILGDIKDVTKELIQFYNERFVSEKSH